MELREYLLRETIKSKVIFTQKQMAEMLGLSVHGFNKIVNRKTSPGLPTAIMIVEFTNNQVSYRELLSHKDTKNFNDKETK